MWSSAAHSSSRSLRIVLVLALLGLPWNAGVGQTAPSSPAAATESSARPSFAVVRIKPSLDREADDWGIGVRGQNFWAVHVTMVELIGWAYGINVRQIDHAPDWFATERFDVDGLPDPGPRPSGDRYRAMLQSALAERFGLRFHTSQKVLQVYVLSVAARGVRLPPANSEAGASWGIHRGWLSITNMTFESAAKVMQRTVFDRPVLDQTGLKDRYTFVLKWRADETQFTQMQGVDVPQENGTEDDEDIYTAARDQLGIRIESRKELAPTIVVDSVSHPSPN